MQTEAFSSIGSYVGRSLRELSQLPKGVNPEHAGASTLTQLLLTPSSGFVPTQSLS